MVKNTTQCNTLLADPFMLTIDVHVAIIRIKVSEIEKYDSTIYSSIQLRFCIAGDDDDDFILRRFYNIDD